MKHTVCSIEFGATDLERATSFYAGVLGWTFAAAPGDSVVFRSPDGVQGLIRKKEQVTPGSLPLLRVEADEVGPILDTAARHDGGYTGFVDPLTGDWTVNLRDPDGNLIRLARSGPDATSSFAKGLLPSLVTESAQAIEDVGLSSAPMRSTAKQIGRTAGRASSEANGGASNGRLKSDTM